MKSELNLHLCSNQKLQKYREKIKRKADIREQIQELDRRMAAYDQIRQNRKRKDFWKIIEEIDQRTAFLEGNTQLEIRSPSKAKNEQGTNEKRSPHKQQKMQSILNGLVHSLGSTCQEKRQQGRPANPVKKKSVKVTLANIEKNAEKMGFHQSQSTKSNPKAPDFSIFLSFDIFFFLLTAYFFIKEIILPKIKIAYE